MGMEVGLKEGKEEGSGWSLGPGMPGEAFTEQMEPRSQH